jgi:hypothetical protein
MSDLIEPQPGEDVSAIEPLASETALIEQGNIDVHSREPIANPDGGYSTVASMSFGTDRGEVVVPRAADGRILSEAEAIERYEQTGEHLGIFKTPEAATAYAIALHDEQAIEYAPRVPLYSQQTEARLSGYSWPEIEDHLDGRMSAALAAGYSEREVRDYLRLPDLKPLQDRLSASWTMATADDPMAFIEPPPSPMTIEPLEAMAAGRIAEYAGQFSPEPRMPLEGEPPMASSLNLSDVQMRESYADALLAGEIKTPGDFAERYAGAYWGALASQGIEIDDSMAASVVRASRSLAASLPSNAELTDAAIAIAHRAGMPLAPETVGVVKENLVRAWKDTGADPMSLYGAADDMDFLARLTTPLNLGGYERHGEILANTAKAFVEGNKQIWNAPENRLTKSLRELHEIFSPSPIGGPIAAGIRLTGNAATAINKTLMGVVAGILGGGAQLVEEILEDRPELRDTPHRSGIEGAGAVESLMVTLAHLGLSGGLAGIRGTPTGRLGDPTSFTGRRPVESLRADPAELTNRAATAVVEKTFADAQAILDAPVKVVDPLKPLGEAVREVPAREAYVPDSLIEAEVRDLALTPVAERPAAAASKITLEIKHPDVAAEFPDSVIGNLLVVKRDGVPLIDLDITKIGNHARIESISTDIETGSVAGGKPNTLGPREVRQVARAYLEANPEIETISGMRVTGARASGGRIAGAEANADLVVTREQIMGRAEPAPAEIVARAEGHDAANAILAHFHNLMIDTAGGGTIEAFFRTAKQKMAAAEYRSGLQFSQATIRQFRGEADRFVAANAAKLDDYRATVNKHVPDYEKLMGEVKAAGPGNARLLDGNPLHEMLKYIEGRSLGATMDQSSPLFPVAEMLRTVNENMRAQIQATIPDMRAFREDYYRHLWKNPDAGALDRIFRIGVQGSGSSLQRRTIPTIAEGIEQGLIPKILNPIDNTMHYVAGMSYHLAAKKILETAEAQKYVQYANAPSDWVQLNGLGATKAFAKDVPPALKAAETRAKNRLAAAIGKPEEAAAREDFRIAAEAAKPEVVIERASAPPGFATSYNYWVGKGFYGMPHAAPWYTKMQYFSNSLTGMLLFPPGFHFVAIAQEVAVNALATGLGAIGRGQIATGMKGIGLGLTVAPEAVRQTVRGREFHRQWLDLDNNSELMTLFTEAGGRSGPRQEIYNFGMARSLFKSVEEGSLKQEIVRDFKDVIGTAEEAPGQRLALLGPRMVGLVGKEIGRTLNTITDPMFDRMIPAVKNAVTFDAMESWLKANPTASLEAKRAMMRRIINSTDDRLGEMNQSNLFWPNTLKQSLNLVTVSLGWEYGSLRAAGLAGNKADQAKLQGRLTMDRLRWLVALPLVDAVMGSAYQFLKTGTLPDSFLQAQFPGIGNGKHATLPGYLGKDFAQWAKIGMTFAKEGVIPGMHATSDWIAHHGNPMKASLWDFLTGEDAIGHKIRGQPMQSLHTPFDQPGLYFVLPREWPQYLSNLWGHVMPIFLQGMARNKADSGLNWADRLFGFREAPTWIEDIRNGTDKFWGGREKGYLKDQRNEAIRYNRENRTLANPGEMAPVPASPGRGGGGRGQPQRATRPDSFGGGGGGGGSRPSSRPDRF